MKLLLPFFALALFVTGCSDADEPIADQTVPNQVVEADTIKEISGVMVPLESIDIKLDLFIEKYMEKYDTIAVVKKARYPLEFASKHYMYRLKKKSTVPYGRSSMVNPIINLNISEYDSTATVMQAVRWFLNGFGDTQGILKVGEDFGAVKTTPTFVIINSYSIIELRYMCEHEENNWDEIKQDLWDFLGDSKPMIMDVGCGGPIVWTTNEIAIRE